LSCSVSRPIRTRTHAHDTSQVGNVVGKRNAHYFALFLWLELAAIVISIGLVVAFYRVALAQGSHPKGLVHTVSGMGSVVRSHTPRAARTELHTAGRRALETLTAMAVVGQHVCACVCVLMCAWRRRTVSSAVQ
jgi:hypothetical protein